MAVLGKTSRQLRVRKTAGLQVPDRTSDGSSSFPEHDLGSTEQCGFAVTEATLAPESDTVKSLFTSRSAPLPSAFDCHSAVLRDLMQEREKICHVHTFF